MLGELKEQGYVLWSVPMQRKMNWRMCWCTVHKGVFDYIQGLTTRQDKAGEPGCADGAGRCGLVLYGGDRFYDREAAKANETAFIGCRPTDMEVRMSLGRGFAGRGQRGDTWATETAGFLHTPGGKPWLKEPWRRP